MKQAECLLEVKHAEGYVGRLRESCTFGGGSNAHTAVSRCSLDSHLALSGFMSIFDLTQGPPRCVHLLPKMDSSARVSGRLAGHIMVWHPSLL